MIGQFSGRFLTVISVFSAPGIVYSACVICTKQTNNCEFRNVIIIIIITNARILLPNDCLTREQKLSYNFFSYFVGFPTFQPYCFGVSLTATVLCEEGRWEEPYKLSPCTRERCPRETIVGQSHLARVVNEAKTTSFMYIDH